MLLSLLLVYGCASKPQVHVFARFLDENQKTAVTQALEQREFDVVVNDYEFPSSVKQNTFVHAALSLSAEQHEQLTSMLEQMGFDNVSSQYVGKGKHSFTRNNLGIYLFGNKNVEIQDPKVLGMLNEYSATKCRTINFADMTLQDNSRVHIILHDPSAPGEGEKSVYGSWLLDGENVYIKPDGDNFTMEFVRKKINEETEYGPRVGWKLIPTYGAMLVDYCEFEHTRVLREW